MSASFYHVPNDTPSPYVGIIDLNSEKSCQAAGGRYRIPSKGLIQLMIYNPEQTGIKLFAVSYNFEDMPGNTRTFLRQVCFW